MKKIISGFFAGLVLLIALSAGYQTYKISPREFLFKGLSFAYVNENIKGMNYDDFLDFLKGEGYDLDRKKIKEIQKKIDGIYLIETVSIFNPNKNPAIILDVGLNFPLYYFRMNEYFNFTGKNYILKSKQLENLGLKKLGIKELYMRPYRGNYIFSEDPGKIEEIISQRTALSDEGGSFLQDKEYGNLGILFFNFKKEGVHGLDMLSVVLDYKKNEMDIFSVLSFRELKMKIPEKGYKTSLEKYAGENTVYVRLKDYVKGYDIARKYFRNMEKLGFILNFWQNILGVDPARILEDIDQEIVYNFQEESGIVKFKQKERIATIVQWLSEKNNRGLELKMELEGDYLYFGDKRISSEQKKSIKLKDNQILYYNRKYDGKDEQFEAFNQERAMKIQGRVNDKVLSEAIDKIKNLGRRVGE